MPVGMWSKPHVGPNLQTGMRLTSHLYNIIQYILYQSSLQFPLQNRTSQAWEHSAF